MLRSELLATAPPAAAARNLLDLARINRWFGGHRTLLSVLHEFVQPADCFSVLDVGAASGDMGSSIGKRYRNAKVVALDREYRHLELARAPKLVADAFALPFGDGSFDFVICSFLLHHFSDGEAIHLLVQMRRLARRALIVLDLERHRLAYLFLPLTKLLLGWSELTVHDGCASVEAAFQHGELESLCMATKPAWAVLRRHLPWFRLSLVMPGQR